VTDEEVRQTAVPHHSHKSLAPNEEKKQFDFNRCHFVVFVVSLAIFTPSDQRAGVHFENN